MATRTRNPFFERLKSEHFMPLLVGLLTVLPIGGLAAQLSAGEPNANDPTPVEHVTSKPRFNAQGLGTIKYAPSNREQPFFEKLAAEERKTGGLAGDYVLSARDGVYVGWFGIVREIAEDETTGRSTLVVEHKYFDGFTDAHLQALSFNGSGDFRAVLRGTGQRIRRLTLVKVYGKVAKGAAGDLSQVDAVFVRNWHWGTFAFLAAHGTQRGSEKWRKLNQVALDDIYNPYPDDAYYEERLGERSEDAERQQVFRHLALEAAKVAGVPAGPLPGAGNAEKPPGNKSHDRLDSDAFRKRALQAAIAVRPGSEAVVQPVIDAILKDDFGAVHDALETAAKLQAEGAAVAVLAEALQLEQQDRRISAADMLARLGFAARTVVPALFGALNDECEDVRNHAATALGNIGPEAQRAIPALLVTLGDQDHFVRSNVCEALGKINSQTKQVVPALIEVMSDGDSHVRWQAVGALGEFGTAAALGAATLSEALLHDSDTNVRWHAATALAAVDTEGRISIPALIEAMQDNDPTVRRFAASGLGMIGLKARVAAPILLKAIQDNDIGARVAAAGALWEVDRNAKAAVPVLTRVLEQDPGIAILWAASALAPIGPEAKDAVPALRRMLTKAPKAWCSGAVDALGNIGPDASAAVPDLVALLDGKEGDLRAYAAGALWKINRHPRAIPTLLDALKNPADDMPYGAIMKIGEIGPPAKDAGPDLVKALSHRTLFVRREAARALERIDPKAKPK